MYFDSLEMFMGSFLCTQYMAKTAKTMYVKCLNKYLKGEPPSNLTNMGIKLYTETNENPSKNKVITQITMSPLKYFRISCIMLLVKFYKLFKRSFIVVPIGSICCEQQSVFFLLVVFQKGQTIVQIFGSCNQWNVCSNFTFDEHLS